MGNHGLIITIGDFVPPDAVFAFQLLFISANMILQNPNNRNPFPCCIRFFFFNFEGDVCPTGRQVGDPYVTNSAV